MLNYTILQLLINYDVSHSPFLSYGANQKVSLFGSSFSHFTSTVLHTSKFFNIDRVLFSNILETPIKVGSAQSSTENKFFTSPLALNSAPNQISVIKKCCFNNTMSKNGNGAIDFNVYLINITIDDCTFYKCTSVEKSGVLSIEFTNDFSGHQNIDSDYYYLNVTNCCFYNCSTNEETRAATLIHISSYFTSLSYSSLSLKDNIVFQCGNLDLSGYISKAYLVVSESNNIEASSNNFTQNEGNLYSLKSASFKPVISETTVVNNKCKSLSNYFSFMTRTSPDIRNLNVVSNNFTDAIVFTADSSVKIENAYFLNNSFLLLITRYEERNFGFTKCVFDFTPEYVTLDDSNIIIDEGKTTETVNVSQKSESSCYVYVSPSKSKASKSSWITVGVFMICGIIANVVIVVTLVLYLRKRRGQKFLTMAEAPSGYDQIYE